MSFNERKKLALLTSIVWFTVSAISGANTEPQQRLVGSLLIEHRDSTESRFEKARKESGKLSHELIDKEIQFRQLYEEKARLLQVPPVGVSQEKETRSTKYEKLRPKLQASNNVIATVESHPSNGPNQVLAENGEHLAARFAQTPFDNQDHSDEIDQLRSINKQLQGESATLKQLLKLEQDSKAVALSALQSKLGVLSDRVDELTQTAQNIPVPSTRIEVQTAFKGVIGGSEILPSNLNVMEYSPPTVLASMKTKSLDWLLFSRDWMTSNLEPFIIVGVLGSLIISCLYAFSRRYLVAETIGNDQWDGSFDDISAKLVDQRWNIFFSEEASETQISKTQHDQYPAVNSLSGKVRVNNTAERSCAKEPVDHLETEVLRATSDLRAEHNSGLMRRALTDKEIKKNLSAGEQVYFSEIDTGTDSNLFLPDTRTLKPNSSQQDGSESLDSGVFEPDQQACIVQNVDGHPASNNHNYAKRIVGTRSELKLRDSVICEFEGFPSFGGNYARASEKYSDPEMKLVDISQRDKDGYVSGLVGYKDVGRMIEQVKLRSRRPLPKQIDAVNFAGYGKFEQNDRVMKERFVSRSAEHSAISKMTTNFGAALAGLSGIRKCRLENEQFDLEAHLFDVKSNALKVGFSVGISESIVEQPLLGSFEQSKDGRISEGQSRDIIDLHKVSKGKKDHDRNIKSQDLDSIDCLLALAGYDLGNTVDGNAQKTEVSSNDGIVINDKEIEKLSVDGIADEKNTEIAGFSKSTRTMNESDRGEYVVAQQAVCSIQNSRLVKRSLNNDDFSISEKSWKLLIEIMKLIDLGNLKSAEKGLIALQNDSDSPVTFRVAFDLQRRLNNYLQDIVSRNRKLGRKNLF